MFTTLKLISNLPVGTIVAYDASSQAWHSATDSTQLIGVISGEPFEDDEGVFYAAVTFGGPCLAIAARDITAEGGGLAVENGAAYVGPLDINRAGEVAPVAYDQTPPLAGDLVLIFLR